MKVVEPLNMKKFPYEIIVLFATKIEKFWLFWKSVIKLKSFSSSINDQMEEA